MNITILGAGNMGSALAKQLARAGHRVRITARDGEKAKAVAAANPGASAAPAATALTGSEVVFLATGFADAIAALRSLGSLEGKIIIDITTPLVAASGPRCRCPSRSGPCPCKRPTARTAQPPGLHGEKEWRRPVRTLGQRAWARACLSLANHQDSDAGNGAGNQDIG